jgi:hypothetical protein
VIKFADSSTAFTSASVCPYPMIVKSTTNPTLSSLKSTKVPSLTCSIKPSTIGALKHVASHSSRESTLSPSSTCTSSHVARMARTDEATLYLHNRCCEEQCIRLRTNMVCILILISKLQQTIRETAHCMRKLSISRDR